MKKKMVRIIAELGEHPEQNNEILEFVLRLEDAVDRKMTKHTCRKKISWSLAEAERIWKISNKSWLSNTYSIELFAIDWIDACACSAKVITIGVHNDRKPVKRMEFGFKVDIIQDVDERSIGKRYIVYKYPGRVRVASDEELAQIIIKYYEKASHA